MIVKLLTEHHLELSFKGGCTGSSESTHVKMPHCWKSHATALISSTSFSSLPLNHSRRDVKYVHEVLVNRFALHLCS